MTIGNKNKDTDFDIVCINCGSGAGLVQVAHRNTLGSIVGYLFLCKECKPSIAGLYRVSLIKIKD